MIPANPRSGWRDNGEPPGGQETTGEAWPPGRVGSAGVGAALPGWSGLLPTPEFPDEVEQARPPNAWSSALPTAHPAVPRGWGWGGVQ